MIIQLTLNNIGLSLDIIGVMLLSFFSTVTSKYNKEGSFSIGGFDDSKDKIIKKYNRDLKITRVAYFFIILGFVLQMITSNPDKEDCHKKYQQQDKVQKIQVK